MRKALLSSAVVCGVLTWSAMAMAADVGQTVTIEKASDQVAAEINDDLRYSMDDWGRMFLDVHELGPRVLPRDFKITVPAFTANTSAETKAELEAMHKFATDERTEETVKIIRAEHNTMPLYKLFAENGFYDFEKAPILNSLLASVDRDVTYFIFDEKKRWQRPRPHQLDGTLTTVVDAPKHSAYPSGHAGQAYGSALVFAKVDPERAEEYKALAREIAHRREVAGVHYPSDGEAGRMIAEQVVEEMFKNPEIQKRFALAKKEFAAARR